MTTTFQKLGNSFALIVTKEEAKILSLKQGDKVSKKITKNSISFQKIKPTKQPKKYTLDELLKGMTKENLHEEIDWGKPVGNEFW